MGFCKGLSKAYLIAANTFVGLTGLGLLGISGYVWNSYSDFAELFSETNLYAGMGVGGGIFLFSLIGCCGAMKQNKCFLTVYLIPTLLLVLAEIAMAVAVFIYLGKMSDVNQEVVGQIKEGLTRGINDYELAAWQKCCSEPYPASFENELPSACPDDADASLEACFYAKNDQWNNLYLDWASEGVCTALSELKQENDDALVGDPSGTTACGGADAAQAAGPRAQKSQRQFQKNVNDWFNDNATWFGYGSIGVLALQVFALFFTFVLLCSNREDYDDEYKQRLAKDATGAELAGTGQAGYTRPTEYV